MSNKLTLGYAALAIAGLMVSGCTKHPKVATSAPVNSGGSQSTASNTGSNQSASNSFNRQPSSTTTNPNTGMSQQDRDSLNKHLANLEDALFDYNKATIRPDATKALESDVAVIRQILTRYPQQKVRIEGNADERGSDEYNMALGDKRAEATKEFLTGLGVSGAQLDVISYGKQRPVCTDHTEDCWQKNRRAHLVAENNGTN